MRAGGQECSASISFYLPAFSWWWRHAAGSPPTLQPTVTPRTPPMASPRSAAQAIPGEAAAATLPMPRRRRPRHTTSQHRRHGGRSVSLPTPGCFPGTTIGIPGLRATQPATGMATAFPTGTRLTGLTSHRRFFRVTTGIAIEMATGYPTGTSPISSTRPLEVSRPRHPRPRAPCWAHRAFRIHRATRARESRSASRSFSSPAARLPARQTDRSSARPAYPVTTRSQQP